MKKINNKDWFINDLMKINNDEMHIYGDGDWFIDENSPFNKKEHIVDAFYGLFFLISIVCLFSLIIIVPVFNIDEKYWILFGLPVIISMIWAGIYHVYVYVEARIWSWKYNKHNVN